ncbi:hypothetical protein HJ201_12540 [Vibrio parahaemolyticus]|nr:hypothetical protein [Vibrio parahaemolyticus]
MTSSKIQLERPETVILKVLQSKKSELVTTVNTREFESDYIFDDVPILNIAKAIEFLKTFDEKMKANDEEEFSDFGFL